MPGQPDPVYPPGQFSLWNRPSVRAAWLGVSRPGEAPADGERDPGYSLLAVSDPSADMTATQTWAVIEDDQRSGGWTPGRPGRDWGSHAEDGGPFPPRNAAGGAASPASQAGRSQGSQASRGQTDRGQAGRDQASLGVSGPGTRRTGQRPPWDSGSQPAAAKRTPAPAAAPASRASRAREPAGGRRGPGRGTARPASAGRRAAKRRKRGTVLMAGLLLSPVLVVVLVVVGYVYINSRHASLAGHPSAPTHPVVVASSPAPSLGPWKHIENRAQDTLPLTVNELFPPSFPAGSLTGVRTVTRAGTKCAHEVIGTALRDAVHKAKCTQVLRASYLSSDRKLMATIGVFNLAGTTQATRVGKTSGTNEFIKPLPAAHGPTHKLARGTGLEEANVMGHYLILTWAEFSNLHKPSGKKQLTELKNFSVHLITGTANVSLTSRMITGKPRVP